MNYKQIKIEGDLIFLAPDAKAQFKEASNHKYVELDFSGVESLDSCGLDLIIALYKELKKKNGSLKIKNVKDSIVEIFKIAGLTKIVEIHN